MTTSAAAILTMCFMNTNLLKRKEAIDAIKAAIAHSYYFRKVRRRNPSCSKAWMDCVDCVAGNAEVDRAGLKAKG